MASLRKSTEDLRWIFPLADGNIKFAFERPEVTNIEWLIFW